MGYPSQHELRHSIPKLQKMANSNFIELFAKNIHEMDTTVMQFLKNGVFEIQLHKPETDKRLKKMAKEGGHITFNYVSLVLFPEVFTSWVRSRREGITSQEASNLYQAVGNIVTRQTQQHWISCILSVSMWNDRHPTLDFLWPYPPLVYKFPHPLG